MELMGLGLPLQGPGWTECACVRVVREGRYLHGAPPDGLERGGCACFWTPAASLVRCQQPGPDHQPAKVGVEESAFLLQLYVRLSYYISSMIIITPGPMDACWTFHMVGRRLTSRSKWMDCYQPFVTSQRGTHPAKSLEQGWAIFLKRDQEHAQQQFLIHSGAECAHLRPLYH